MGGADGGEGWAEWQVALARCTAVPPLHREYAHRRDASQLPAQSYLPSDGW